jgi:AAA15 family ATPase/GTPase
MNDTFFKNIHISNFKSLKSVTLNDCKRINVLIGKPNVGKSNILEAIGLFSLPYVKYNKSKKITQFIRLEHLTELFFDGNTEEKINIKTDEGSFCFVEYLPANNNIEIQINLERQTVILEGLVNSPLSPPIILKKNEDHVIVVDNKFNFVGRYKKRDYPSPKVRFYKFPYIFTPTNERDFLNVSGLYPPSGDNLFEIVQYQKELKKGFIDIFAEYGLKLLFDKNNNSLRIMKEVKSDEVFSLSLNSIADTLQRLIFFKTAIASNKNSILLFEEPEAHCFPPYISYFTRDVIYSETNQFFIATHSPYVLNDFLEYKRDDVAIFMADFRDGQTVINRLSDDEVNEVYEYGIDVFFNYERFTR